MNLFRTIIIADTYRWIGIDYEKVAHLLAWRGYRTVFASQDKAKKSHDMCIDGNCREIIYKNINLYDAVLYNLCVELEVHPSYIELNNHHHRQVIKKYFILCANYIDYIDSVINKLKPIKILVSQGYTHESFVVRAMSCYNKFTVVSVENTFNSSKIVWDDLSGITVNKNLSKNYYWKLREFVSSEVSDQYVFDYISNVKNFKVTEHQTPNKKMDKDSLKTVLFIGQVYTDASVLFGIHDFRCPVDIIETLVDYCLLNDYKLIVKLHPKEVGGESFMNKPFDNLTLRRINQREGLAKKIESENIVVDRADYDTYSLIDVADVCVTVNSQAGLEALINGKNVVICGQCFYSGIGMTLEAFNVDHLVCTLDMVLKKNISVVDSREINKFFYIVNEHYFMPKTEESVQRLLLN